jgi:hypothetical protein
MSDDQILAMVGNELAIARKALSEMIKDGEFYDDLRRSEKTQYACGRVDGLASLERKFRNMIEPEEGGK